MYIDELIRNKFYFILDKLKGGVVLSNVKVLANFENYSSEKKNMIIAEKLDILLDDIIENVEFYQNKKSFESLPIIDKKMISQNVEAFYSKRFIKQNLVEVHTSGSYGTPLSYYLTPNKKKYQLAEVIYFGRKAHYDVGVRHGYFRSNPHKSNLKFWIQNETFFASKILSTDFLNKGIKNLKKKKIKVLIGFPSAITYLAKGCLERGYTAKDFNVKGVITSSENLTSQQREIIKNAFNCEIHSRYSTEELGVLAQQYETEGSFHFNTCNYIVEILDLQEDRSVGIGEIGRIVVTDLHSNAMPLVRYETGDLGILEEFLFEEKGWVSKMKQLSGRKVQLLYSTKGDILYPLYFDTIMDNYNCFIQYQIIQEAEKEYVINLVVNNEFVEESFDLDVFRNLFYNWLGDDATILVQFVDDIEKLPSGKRPYVINRYKMFTV